MSSPAVSLLDLFNAMVKGKCFSSSPFGKCSYLSFAVETSTSKAKGESSAQVLYFLTFGKGTDLVIPGS